MEKKVSKLGKLNFLPWKSSFPPLEIYFSKAGKFFGKPVTGRTYTPAERTQKKGQKPLRSLPHTYLS